MLKTKPRIFTKENVTLKFLLLGKGWERQELRCGQEKLFRLFFLDITSATSFSKPYSVYRHSLGTHMVGEQKLASAGQGAKEQAVGTPLSQRKERGWHFLILLKALLLTVYEIITYPSKCSLMFREWKICMKTVIFMQPDPFYLTRKIVTGFLRNNDILKYLWMDKFELHISF